MKMIAMRRARLLVLFLLGIMNGGTSFGMDPNQTPQLLHWIAQGVERGARVVSNNRHNQAIIDEDAIMNQATVDENTKMLASAENGPNQLDVRDRLLHKDRYVREVRRINGGREEWVSVETLKEELRVARTVVDKYKKRKELHDEEKKDVDILKNLLVTSAQNALEIQKKREDAKIQIEIAKGKSEGDRESRVAEATAKASTYVKGLVAGFQDKWTIGTALLLALGIPGLYFLTKFAYQYALRFVGVPELLRETSKLTFKDWLYETLGMAQEKPEADLSQIVLSPDMQSKIQMLAEDTKETAALGLTYRNVLFYGPPGTGKTEFAKLLAYYSKMDYAIMSGADFNQFSEADRIAKLHELFDWAEKSKRGLIIFIDEADACLRDRSTLTREAVALVNAFLSRTGGSSDKFMIILATNYENELDQAVRSRVHTKIPFLLPGVDERVQILTKKFEKYILNDKRTYVVDGETFTAQLAVAPELTEEYFKEVAENINGFSGRDIDQMIAEVRLRAYRSGQNAVTKAIMEYVVAEKKATIAKDLETTEYQRQRAEAAKKKNELAVAAA